MNLKTYRWKRGRGLILGVITEFVLKDRKTTKYLTQDMQAPCRDSNLGRPEHDAEALSGPSTEKYVTEKQCQAYL
jgi:hypothetical protein